MATFTGTAANEVIIPAAVSATVTSDPPGSRPGSGSDTLNGGGGDDLIIWREGDGSDLVNGSAGIDTQRLIMSDAANVVGLAPDTTGATAFLFDNTKTF